MPLRSYADFNGLVAGPRRHGCTAVVLDTLGSLRDLWWWVIEFEDAGVRYVPAGDRSAVLRFLCVHCRADLASQVADGRNGRRPDRLGPEVHVGFELMESTKNAVIRTNPGLATSEYPAFYQVVGPAGFEPANAGVKVPCLTA